MRPFLALLILTYGGAPAVAADAAELLARLQAARDAIHSIEATMAYSAVQHNPKGERHQFVDLHWWQKGDWILAKPTYYDMKPAKAASSTATFLRKGKDRTLVEQPLTKGLRGRNAVWVDHPDRRSPPMDLWNQMLFCFAANGPNGPLSRGFIPYPQVPAQRKDLNVANIESNGIDQLEFAEAEKKKEIITLDPQHGYWVQSRTETWPSMGLVKTGKVRRFQEVLPGMWLPTDIELAMRTDQGKTLESGNVSIKFHSINSDIPDELFSVEYPRSAAVADYSKGTFHNVDELGVETPRKSLKEWERSHLPADFNELPPRPHQPYWLWASCGGAVLLVAGLVVRHLRNRT